jgi:hypothetical protein
VTSTLRALLSSLGLLFAALPANVQAWGTSDPLADPWVPQPGLGEQAANWVSDVLEQHADALDSGTAQFLGDLVGGGAGSAAANAATRSGEAADASNALSDMDRALDESRSRVETDSPPIPLSCEGNAACMECYRGALEQLARQRILLARLHAIYVSTHRFADTSRTMGDGLAGLHSAAGVGWHYQKLRISRSLTTFDQTYDAKFEAMMEVLREVLMDIARCEEEHFNNRDWFTRFGFMYYEFLDARYRRPGA